MVFWGPGYLLSRKVSGMVCVCVNWEPARGALDLIQQNTSFMVLGGVEREGKWGHSWLTLTPL